jgi:hypothetical protein
MSLMVVLRATQKVLHLMEKQTTDDARSDTALGDWYVKRLVVDRHPLFLLVSSESLLSILIPARDARHLPDRLPELVATRLRRLGVAQRHVDAEVSAMNPVAVGPTRDRSVLGSLVDFAKAVPFHLPIRAWDVTTLPFVEAELAQTPCRAAARTADVIFPDRTAPQLLEARWG